MKRVSSCLFAAVVFFVIWWLTAWLNWKYDDAFIYYVLGMPTKWPPAWFAGVFGLAAGAGILTAAVLRWGWRK